MANSIDDILSKSSPEQQERFKQATKDFKEQVTSTNTVASTDKSVSQTPPLTQEQQDKFKQVAQDFQIKGENATQATKPQTPSQTQPNPTALDKAQPDAQTTDRIKSIEQGKGNNYQNDNRPPNAVDKALSVQGKEGAKEAAQNLSKQGVISNDKDR